jgi:hypothetical protein
MHPSLHRYHRSIGDEVVRVCKLDSICDEYLKGNENVYLKINTQGFEKNVIIGTENVLRRIRGIQMELSLVLLYQGETLIGEMINVMSNKGFTLVSIEPGFYDKSSGQLLQADCIFFRSDLLDKNGFIL